MKMAGLNGEIIIRTSEFRPCFVKGKKALFHCWEPKMQVVGESMLRGGHSAGQLAATFGIVEYEDGTVRECYPHEIRFCDNKLEEYHFPVLPEEG